MRSMCCSKAVLKEGLLRICSIVCSRCLDAQSSAWTLCCSRPTRCLSNSRSWLAGCSVPSCARDSMRRSRISMRCCNCSRSIGLRDFAGVPAALRGSTLVGRGGGAARGVSFTGRAAFFEGGFAAASVCGFAPPVSRLNSRSLMPRTLYGVYSGILTQDIPISRHQSKNLYNI